MHNWVLAFSFPIWSGSFPFPYFGLLEISSSIRLFLSLLLLLPRTSKAWNFTKWSLTPRNLLVRELQHVRGGDPADAVPHPLPALPLPPLQPPGGHLLARLRPPATPPAAPLPAGGGHDGTASPHLRNPRRHAPSQHRHRYRGVASNLPPALR